MPNLSTIFRLAEDYARKNYPNISEQHLHAFVRSVSYLARGGYWESDSGLSVRERAVAHETGEIVEKWAIENAIDFAEKWVLGPIGETHRVLWATTVCVHDDPRDVLLLRHSSNHCDNLNDWLKAE